MLDVNEPIALNARNPGPMTGSGNTTYLLSSGSEAVLIDAGVGHLEHVADLQRNLSERRATLRTVLVTHGHADHASGAPAIAHAYPSASFEKHVWAGDEAPCAVAWHHLRDGDVVAFGDDVLSVVYTPGHSPDHLAFWHQATGALFTGDLVIAGGSVMIQASRGGNLAQYLRSLERVLELKPRLLLPAHGPCIEDPEPLVRGYIEHRNARERQVLSALAAGHRSVETIAESIYDGLDPRLLPAARENVRAHLEKLAVEGIAADQDGWRTL